MSTAAIAQPYGFPVRTPRHDLGLQRTIRSRHDLSRIRGLVIVSMSMLLTMLSLSTGCQSPDQEHAQLSHNLVLGAVGSLRSGPPGHELETTQLEALLGKPELVLSEEDFLVLLFDIDAAAAARWEDKVTRFCRRKDEATIVPSVSERGGEAAEAAEGCSVWLYRWDKPLTVRLTKAGGTLLYTARTVTEKWSYAYLVSMGRVIYANRIVR